jgi:hypothetical protein
MPSEVIALDDSCTGDALTDKIISNTADKATQSVHDIKSQDNDLKSKELAVNRLQKFVQTGMRVSMVSRYVVAIVLVVATLPKQNWRE